MIGSVLASVLLLLLPAAGANAETIVFSGSTTVQSRILEPLAEEIRVEGIARRTGHAEPGHRVPVVHPFPGSSRSGRGWPTG